MIDADAQKIVVYLRTFFSSLHLQEHLFLLEHNINFTNKSQNYVLLIRKDKGISIYVPIML